MGDLRDMDPVRRGEARSPIDWALVARAEAWARREQAATVHRIIFAPLARTARAAMARARTGVSAPPSRPCTSDAA
ncbi:MAG: hypothetical protein M5U08_02910 [Burkholderiales bacterium]|nr:hypothetical protein [Burkholderiales bacterium]